MSEIKEDIIRAAKMSVFEFETWVQTTHLEDAKGANASNELSNVIAKAILAERQRNHSRPPFIKAGQLTGEDYESLRNSDLGMIVPVPSDDKWQDISTAPKDGSYILLAHFSDNFEEVVGGSWNLYPKKGQEGLNGFNAWIDAPTHWMPIPSPPKP